MSALHTVYASFCKQRSDISHSKEQAPLHIVYSSFFKQRSDISHEKEQARYTLCVSLNKNWRTDYTLFFKQRSDISHAKEQAHYTVCDKLPSPGQRFSDKFPTAGIDKMTNAQGRWAGSYTVLQNVTRFYMVLHGFTWFYTV